MSLTPALQMEKFGKYLLLEKIAAGGMAEVYLAKSAAANGLNKFVAVKRILPQYFSNEEFISMFKEEAKVAINLNHSNVVSIFDFGIENKQFFLVMEFVEGRNLRQIINELKKNNKSFTIDQAIFMIKEVAAGLDHAHRCVDANSGRPLNITHRDMSPQNIMVSFEGEVKVIDFGIAKAETEKEETKAGTLKGKFSYMSPEQAEGLPIDPRTDIFALGIVLWELLANDRLFTGSNEAAILRKVRDCQIPPIRKVNPLVPQELERIVMKALAKDRNVRYQTAANLHRDLNRFLNMQYPDFSSHDFSSFLKDSFKVSYLEAREKLIHYSKAEIKEVTLTATMAPPPPLAKEPHEPPKAIPTTEIPPAFKMEPPVKINLDGVLGPNVVNKSRIGTPAPARSSGNLGHTRHTQVTSTGYTGYTKSRVQKTDYFEVVLKLMIFGLIVGGGFYGYKNGFSFKDKPETRIAKGDDNLKGQIDMAAIAMVKVSVSSHPAGARIFVDGNDTKNITPAIISLTANKDTTISFRKDGYLTYEVIKRPNNADKIEATLQVAAASSFISIYVSNGGPSTKIFVNDKELSEKAPVIKYPIVADKDAVVRAYNPITRQSDEVKLKLRAGENKSIELILGRQPEAKKR